MSEFKQLYFIGDRVMYTVRRATKYRNAKGTVIGVNIRQKIHMRFEEENNPDEFTELYLVKFDDIRGPRWLHRNEISYYEQ